MKAAIRPARELYAATPAVQFGPKALAAVRQHMVGLGWCRSLVNRQVDRIRRAMRWAASEELIPGLVNAHTHLDLSGARGPTARMRSPCTVRTPPGSGGPATGKTTRAV